MKFDLAPGCVLVAETQSDACLQYFNTHSKFASGYMDGHLTFRFNVSNCPVKLKRCQTVFEFRLWLLSSR